MAPHATDTNGEEKPINNGEVPHEPGVKKDRGEVIQFPKPPTFEDKYKERDYLKGRLAAAFRIFGKYGFDEGVAGHITLRDPVQPDCFWVNPFGVAFSLINKSDLIVCLLDHVIVGIFADINGSWSTMPAKSSMADHVVFSTQLLT